MFLAIVEQGPQVGGMSRARSSAWFAHHEARLAWRDTLAMMTAGRPNRERRVGIWLAAFAIAAACRGLSGHPQLRRRAKSPDLPTS